MNRLLSPQSRLVAFVAAWTACVSTFQFASAEPSTDDSLTSIQSIASAGPPEQSKTGIQLKDIINNRTALDGHGQNPHRAIQVITKKSVDDDQAAFLNENDNGDPGHGDLSGISVDVLANNRSFADFPDPENPEENLKMRNGFLGIYSATGISTETASSSAPTEFNYLDFMVGVLGSATLKDAFVNSTLANNTRYMRVRDRGSLSMIGGIFSSELDSEDGYVANDPMIYAAGVVGNSSFSRDFAVGNDATKPLGGNVSFAYGGDFGVSIKELVVDGNRGRAEIDTASGVSAKVEIGDRSMTHGKAHIATAHGIKSMVSAPGGSIDKAYGIYSSVETKGGSFGQTYALYTKGAEAVVEDLKWKDWAFASKAKLYNGWSVFGIGSYAEATDSKALALVPIDFIGSDQKEAGTLLYQYRIKWQGAKGATLVMELCKRYAAKPDAQVEKLFTEKYSGTGDIKVETVGKKVFIDEDYVYFLVITAPTSKAMTRVYDIGVSTYWRTL